MLYGGDEASSCDTLAGLAHSSALAVCVWESWRGLVSRHGRVRERTHDHYSRTCTRAMAAWEQWACVERQRQLQRQGQLSRRDELLQYASKLATSAGKAKTRQLMFKVWSAWWQLVSRNRCPRSSKSFLTADSAPCSHASVRTRVSLLGRETVIALRSFAAAWIAPLENAASEHSERWSVLRAIFSGWAECAISNREAKLMDRCSRSAADVERALTISLAFARTLARQVASGGDGQGSGGCMSSRVAIDVSPPLPKTEFSSRSNSYSRVGRGRAAQRLEARGKRASNPDGQGGRAASEEEGASTEFDLSDSDVLDTSPARPLRLREAADAAEAMAVRASGPKSRSLDFQGSIYLPETPREAPSASQQDSARLRDGEVGLECLRGGGREQGAARDEGDGRSGDGAGDGEEKERVPLTDGWRTRISRKWRRRFYYNTVTGQTQWHRPCPQKDAMSGSGGLLSKAPAARMPCTTAQTGDTALRVESAQEDSQRLGAGGVFLVAPAQGHRPAGATADRNNLTGAFDRDPESSEEESIATSCATPSIASSASVPTSRRHAVEAMKVAGAKANAAGAARSADESVVEGARASTSLFSVYGALGE